MPRCGRDLVRLADLDDLAAVEHGDPVADLVDDAEVVADEQVGHPGRLLELLEQVEHPRLRGDVERAGRLVADDDRRIQGQGSGDRDPLPLSAGELPRVAAAGVRRQPDRVEQLPHPGAAALDAGRVRAARPGCSRSSSTGSATSTGPGRRPGCRVASLRRRAAGDVADASRRGSVIVPPVTGARPEDGPADRGLARAGLADQAQRLAGGEVEGDAVDDGGRACRGARESDHEVLTCRIGSALERPAGRCVMSRSSISSTLRDEASSSRV